MSFRNNNSGWFPSNSRRGLFNPTKETVTAPADELIVVERTGDSDVYDVDLSKGDFFSIVLPDGAGPYTINFTGLSVETNILYIKQNTTADGVATIAGVEWPAGTAPTITAIANKVDIVTLVYDGTTLRGVITQDYN